MPAPIRVGPGVQVPGAALEWRAVRASGPGGQNVNKVASKVELRVDVERVEGLTDEQRARLSTLIEGRRAADGRLLVTSQRTRDQAKNLADTRDKVRRLVQKALLRPRARRKTEPTAASRERRRRHKRRQAEVKLGRRRVVDLD